MFSFNIFIFLLLLVLDVNLILGQNDLCTCGLKGTVNRRKRLVGGQEAGINEFPMMAGILDTKKQNLFCGGTIISQTSILTAASCLFAKDKSNLAVVVGEHDTSTGEETDATRTFKVEKVIIHPGYFGIGVSAFAVQQNNIGLVKVQGSISFSSKVGPACLPYAFTNENFFDKTVIELGYGELSPGGTKSNTLQKVEVQVVSLHRCFPVIPIFNKDKFLCIFTAGKGACEGDVGGPLLYQNEGSGKLFVVGIIASVRSCIFTLHVSQPDADVRVSSYIPWIEDVTGESFCKNV